jgi:hypothetical protein
MGRAQRGVKKKIDPILTDWRLLSELGLNDPTNALYVACAPLMERISRVTAMAERTRVLNRALGTSLSPDEIDRMFATEDIDLIIAWKEHYA